MPGVGQPVEDRLTSRRAAIPYLVAAFVLAAVLTMAGPGGFAGWMGRATGTLMWPALVAWLRHGRRRNWIGFGRWLFVGVLIAVAVFSLARP